MAAIQTPAPCPSSTTSSLPDGQSWTLTAFSPRASPICLPSFEKLTEKTIPLGGGSKSGCWPRGASAARASPADTRKQTVRAASQATAPPRRAGSVSDRSAKQLFGSIIALCPLRSGKEREGRSSTTLRHADHCPTQGTGGKSRRRPPTELPGTLPACYVFDQ